LPASHPAGRVEASCLQVIQQAGQRRLACKSSSRQGRDQKTPQKPVNGYSSVLSLNTLE